MLAAKLILPLVIPVFLIAPIATNAFYRAAM
jgi:hypothetical protein